MYTFARCWQHVPSRFGHKAIYKLMTHTSQNVRGRLHLGFTYQPDSKHTSLALCEQQPPLQVIRAFSLPQGGALVHLHNLSGGVLGGDQLELSVEVGPHAYAQLTTTSATRVYRSHADAPMALQTNDIQVREIGRASCRERV